MSDAGVVNELKMYIQSNEAFVGRVVRHSFTDIPCHNSWTLVAYYSEVLGYAAVAVGKCGFFVGHVPPAAAHVLTRVRMRYFCLIC